MTVELGLAAVLGVLVHAIAAMAGVGLFVSYGLTAVACALGLYCGRSMTQPMKEHRAESKQKAKRKIELQKQYNAVRMDDECLRIGEARETATDTWMKDRENLDNITNVADVYGKVKALMLQQEETFSKLPEADQAELKNEVVEFLEGQARFYAQELKSLWGMGFPVDSILQSQNEEGMPQGWSRLKNHVKTISEEMEEKRRSKAEQKDQGKDGSLSRVEKKERSKKTSQDANKPSGKSEKKVPSEATGTTTGELSVMPTTSTGVDNSHTTGVDNSHTADSKQETLTAQDVADVVAHENGENSLSKAEEYSTSTSGLGLFNPQNGTGSHNDEAKSDADPSSAAGGDFQPTRP